MRKRLLAIALVTSLLSVVCSTQVAAAPRETKEAKRARATKIMITQVGTGPKARIAIRLRDKTDLKGYVSEAADDHFVITDEKTHATTTVTYAQVEKVKFVPYLTSALKEDVSSGRFFKRAVIATGALIGGVLVFCLVSNRCTD